MLCVRRTPAIHQTPMAFFRGHLWGGLIATLIAIVLVIVGLWWKGTLGPYLTLEESPKLALLLCIGSRRRYGQQIAAALLSPTDRG